MDYVLKYLRCVYILIFIFSCLSLVVMGDSDEEYDRRRRDKFRRERSDYQERGREERGRRDDWSERCIYF